MCNNSWNNGFDCWWIIILILIFSCCGGGSFGGCGCIGGCNGGNNSCDCC